MPEKNQEKQEELKHTSCLDPTDMLPCLACIEEGKKIRETQATEKATPIVLTDDDLAFDHLITPPPGYAFKCTACNRIAIMHYNKFCPDCGQCTVKESVKAIAYVRSQNEKNRQGI